MPKSKSKRSRYQPPPKAKPRPSPRWLGASILVILLLGVIVIVFNYLGLVPGGTKDLYLWVGLGLIAVGFAAATQWR